MTFGEIWFLALALSVDAFAVAFSYGLIIRKNKAAAALKIAAAAGSGQFIMPVLGWYGAGAVYHLIAAVDHWIAFFVFGTLGLKIIGDALREKDNVEKPDNSLSFKILLLIGIGTSIDAFVSGSMLYLVRVPVWPAAGLIGTTTFCCALIGFNFCRIFKNCRLSTRSLEIAAGLILIALGGKILFEHLSA